MKADEIRQGFLDYFERHGHRIVQSSPVIPLSDPTLLFTNAGMNQFKDVFLGTGTREYVRAADTQKCIRVSGKHNDLEEVGRDTYHHTFFEMLGNWSFGDYYKTEAIGWAWELLTGVWGLDKKRLYATVYETDDEAASLWRNQTDINPSHIVKFGKKDNFWEMGETGPCGPCSEIHIDLTPDCSGGNLVNAGDPRVMEIWNLVFIQNNRNASGELEDLPAKHVDTGMGFERICAVLQGKRSNYDTDVFMPVINAIAEASGRPYEGDDVRVAMRVIADHVRMLSFAIADGALPGNEGRGYVLRRILRRGARFARKLDIRDPFIYKITDAVAGAMGHVFPELIAQHDHIKRVIRSEEESFNATLDRGLEIFESVLERIGHSTVFPGTDAFRLYDTYGFPLDLTELMAEERGLKVDTGEFTKLMEEQKNRGRTGPKAEFPGQTEDAHQYLASFPDAQFVGYTTTETDAVVGKVVEGRFLSLDRTPFYAKAGGQVDDIGVIEGDGFAAEVVQSYRQDKRIVHEVRMLRGTPADLHTGPVRARIDLTRRQNIQRNHSATHLVHEALRRVLGPHAHQQGSLVAPDRLRFDFPHFGKITPDELRAIEEIVNEKIGQRIPVVTAVDLPIAEAQKIPNVKMFFDDKYGDYVRVVIMDEKFSVEFCGGTHVENTADIGLFKIVSEFGIQSGVRRIEAVTGAGIRTYIDERLAHARELDDKIDALLREAEELERQLPNDSPARSTSTRPSLGALTIPAGTPQSDAVRIAEERLEERQACVEEEQHRTAELRKYVSKSKVEQAASNLDSLVAAGKTVGNVTVVAAKIEAADLDELKRIGDELRVRLTRGVGVLGTVLEEKATFVCVVTDDLVAEKKLQAGRIVGEVAKLVGGGGGGRPHMATAGGKDVGKLDAALWQVTEIVARTLR
jgi:alanyl-tRNA synthetase